eukprot:TRINITY_DN33090_c0_g1_i1.p1 TRINITY_DN33090_c0_g1~~TRINITY_DN33090_c0_g1_i1.p1  ORF type:complete len:119 (+),score=18.50 TRINITY_DN33090_c0_g1_i1:255-611(+)
MVGIESLFIFVNFSNLCDRAHKDVLFLHVFHCFKIKGFRSSLLLHLCKKAHISREESLRPLPFPSLSLFLDFQIFIVSLRFLFLPPHPDLGFQTSLPPFLPTEEVSKVKEIGEMGWWR